MRILLTMQKALHVVRATLIVNMAHAHQLINAQTDVKMAFSDPSVSSNAHRSTKNVLCVVGILLSHLFVKAVLMDIILIQSVHVCSVQDCVWKINVIVLMDIVKRAAKMVSGIQSATEIAVKSVQYVTRIAEIV